MEDVKIDPQFDDEEFFDSMEDFMFYGCEEQFFDDTFEVEDEDSGSVTFTEPLLGKGILHPVSLRRRRSFKSSMAGDSIGSSMSRISGEANKCHKISRNEVSHSVESNNTLQALQNAVSSEALPMADAIDNTCDSVPIVRQHPRSNNEAHTSFLFLLAGLLVKAISLQVHYFFTLVLFPIRFMFRLHSIIVDPFGFLDRCKKYLIQRIRRICVLALGLVSSSVRDWLAENKVLWKFTLKCAWGLLWSSYVCTILAILLLSAFMVGGLLVNIVVKGPIRLKSTLNFDYTQKSPVAFVPIIADNKLNHDVYIAQKDKIKGSGLRVIPPQHKLQVEVSLTLPESVYNHELGIFQVRVDLVDGEGIVLASSRRPCLLHYRSQPIHLLMTFFKLAPILTGYSSESQTLKINFKGFVEGNIPTSAIRAVLEPRAEYPPGAGIPEIYDASLILESELPFLKRFLWLWKKTLFVWVSISLFVLELMLALVCCKPVIMPKIRPRPATNQDTSPLGS